MNAQHKQLVEQRASLKLKIDHVKAMLLMTPTDETTRFLELELERLVSAEQNLIPLIDAAEDRLVARQNYNMMIAGLDAVCALLPESFNTVVVDGVHVDRHLLRDILVAFVELNQ